MLDTGRQWPPQIICLYPAIIEVALYPASGGNHSSVRATEGEGLQRTSCTQPETGGDGEPSPPKGSASCGTALGTQHNCEVEQGCGGRALCLPVNQKSYQREKPVFPTGNWLGGPDSIQRAGTHTDSSPGNTKVSLQTGRASGASRAGWPHWDSLTRRTLGAETEKTLRLRERRQGVAGSGPSPRAAAHGAPGLPRAAHSRGNQAHRKDSAGHMCSSCGGTDEC